MYMYVWIQPLGKPSYCVFVGINQLKCLLIAEEMECQQQVKRHWIDLTVNPSCVCRCVFTVFQLLTLWEPSFLWCLGGSLCWPFRFKPNHTFATVIRLAWSHVAVFSTCLFIRSHVILLHCLPSALCALSLDLGVSSKRLLNHLSCCLNRTLALQQWCHK